MSELPDDSLSSLEEARERLYRPRAPVAPRSPLSPGDDSSVPHAWGEKVLRYIPREGHERVRLATLFFIVAVVFFLGSLAIAALLFFLGGNAVSVDRIALAVQGPTAISGGDTVPLSITATNKNTTAIQNAVLEVDFPGGTRDASNVLAPYPHYSENIGALASGASITRSVRAVIFGRAGQSITIPISFSYGIAGSNAVFVKKSAYTLTVGSTPLEVSVDAPSETVSGKPLTFDLTIRSNASIPLSNVVLVGDFPFGFTETSASLPLNNSSFLLGTLAPGETKRVSLTGTLTGQDKEQRVFHFTVGTASSPANQTLAVTYMTQDTTVSIASPFLATSLALNGDTRSTAVISPGAVQNVAVSYTNTLASAVENANVVIAISGNAVDYNTIQSSSGFYRSTDHTIIFSRDTDPALALLAPGASGVGAFSFSTLPAASLTGSPSVTFTVSVSGTRSGETNVPELVSASLVRTVKVATAAVLSARSLHFSGPISNSGPIPPKANQVTTYTIQLSVQNRGSAVAGAIVSTILPSYVTYTGQVSGSGSFAYNDASRTVAWTIGDLGASSATQGFFQVSLTPSTSQRGSAPALTGPFSFSGFDRFASIQVNGSADPVTTETTGDAGYTPTNASVQ